MPLPDTAPLPPPVLPPLAEGEVVVASLTGDLDRDGRFGTGYLAVTDRRILSGDAAGPIADLPLAGVGELVLDELYGRGRLMAKGKDGAADRFLLLYSANRIHEVAALVRTVNPRLAGRAAVEPDAVEPACCTVCGLPLPERGGLCPRCLPRRRLIARLLGLVLPHRKVALALVGLTFLTVGLQMVPPFVARQITDRVIVGGARAELAWWIGLMAGAFLFQHGGRYAANRCNSWLSNRVVADLRAALHARLQRLSLRYHQRHPSGELIGRVTSDTGRLQHFLVDGLPYFLVNSVSFVAIAAVLLALDPVLACLVFLPAPVLLFGGAAFWRRLIPLFHKEGNRVGALHAVLGESIRAVKTVKAAVQEGRRERQFAEVNTGLRGVLVKVEATWFGFFEGMALTMSIGALCVWAFGADRILGHRMTMGDLVAFIGYMGLFYGPLQWFTAIFNWMTHAMACSQRIFQVLDHPSEDRDAPGAVTLPERVHGHIRLEDVRFSYERGKEVIKGLDLEVKPGEMVGLVGKSGAGKSTIINLVCRFYDPDSGRVLIDGHDLRQVAYASWRRQVGIVLQEPFLFNATILDNIRYARPEATLAEVVAAAQAACAHDFICDKEEGYDTVVGEGGASLSGGEKQRLAIARAILADPPVLILDEATSSVDGETEKQIQEAITRLVRGRTVIAIAHRLATLRNADRLVVVEDGAVVEQGTHAELLARPDGRFAKMVAVQSEINKLRSEQHVWTD